MERTGQLGERKRRFQPVRVVEARLIREALEICSGNCVEAARILGIGKSSIYRKLKGLGISRKARRPDYEQAKQELLKQFTEESSQ